MASTLFSSPWCKSGEDVHVWMIGEKMVKEAIRPTPTIDIDKSISITVHTGMPRPPPQAIRCSRQ